MSRNSRIDRIFANLRNLENYSESNDHEFSVPSQKMCGENKELDASDLTENFSIEKNVIGKILKF